MKLQLSKIFKPLMMLLVVSASFQSCKKNSSEEIKPEIPQISSIQPKNPAPGDVVTITGTGFGTALADVKVTIGSTAITVSSVTATEIKFTVPTTITAGDLSVLIKDVAAAIKDPQGATITPKPVTSTIPTFTAMSPASGKSGDVITLTGTNFSTRISDNKVFFATTTGGTVVLATIKTATATTMTVEVPASAITGGVTISVNSVNAVAATGFNTTFTVISNSNGTGTSTVDYIDAKSGALKFSKITSATSDIGAMHLDKAKNWIYFSDYTLLKYNNTSRVFKVDPAGGVAPVLLTDDPRISMVTHITSDASGNIFVLKYESGLNYSIYKITPDGATITEIAKNFELFAGRTHFFIDANNQIHLRPFLKFKMDGTKITSGPININGLQKDNGAYFAGNFAYFSQDPDNGQNASTCRFIKYNLSDDTFVPTDFTLKSLYGTDDPEVFKENRNIPFLKYCLDADENFYSIMEKSYVSGSIGKTWMIRKTKNGSASSTALGSFVIKFPAIDLNDYSTALEFVSDSRGNLFFKANSKDIIRIVQ
ncbi:IPT/TIG domain-containing protein [Pedobacter sp. PWIIR3]